MNIDLDNITKCSSNNTSKKKIAIQITKKDNNNDEVTQNEEEVLNLKEKVEVSEAKDIPENIQKMIKEGNHDLARLLLDRFVKSETNVKIRCFIVLSELCQIVGMKEKGIEILDLVIQKLKSALIMIHNKLSKEEVAFLEKIESQQQQKLRENKTVLEPDKTETDTETEESISISNERELREVFRYCKELCREIANLICQKAVLRSLDGGDMQAGIEGLLLAKQIAPEHFNVKRQIVLAQMYYRRLEFEEAKKVLGECGDPIFEFLSQLIVPIMYDSTEDIHKTRETLLNKTIPEMQMALRFGEKKKYVCTNLEQFNNHYLPNLFNYLYPLSYQGISNKKLLYEQADILFKVFPFLRYETPNLGKRRVDWKTTKPRIGFISNNFCLHSVSRDRAGIIRNISRDLFDVYVYWFAPPKDSMARYIYDGKQTNIILPNGYFQKRGTIATHHLDVLVYCDIGMHIETYFLAMARLATYQITTWGHSDTSGLHTIDKYISSELYERPVNASEFYYEKLVQQKGLCTYYHAIQPTDINSEKIQSMQLSDFNLPNAKRVYLCAQLLTKILPCFDRYVNAILEKDHEGIVVFINCNYSPKIIRQFMNRLEKNIEPTLIGRVHVAPWQTSESRFMALIRNATVILDTYPFGGCNTTLTSFDMNRVVISHPGPYINGRFTYGFYKKMGILEKYDNQSLYSPIVNSIEEYANTAVEYANNEQLRHMLENDIEVTCRKYIFGNYESVTEWNDTLLSMTPLVEDKNK